MSELPGLLTRCQSSSSESVCANVVNRSTNSVKAISRGAQVPSSVCENRATSCGAHLYQAKKVVRLMSLPSLFCGAACTLKSRTSALEAYASPKDRRPAMETRKIIGKKRKWICLGFQKSIGPSATKARNLLGYRWVL